MPSARALLSLFALRLAERGRLCGTLRTWDDARRESEALRERTGGVLPPWPLPAQGCLLEAPASLCAAAEELFAKSRRETGAYYTPLGLADEVVSIALAQGSIGKTELPAVFDPCAGAGAFLVAAARALSPRKGPLEAVRACSGSDIDLEVLRIARAALFLEAPLATADQLRSLQLRRADSLRWAPDQLVDLLVTNPPYGHQGDPRERAFLAALLPGLRGGEIDRYAAFLLRSLALVRPGGTAALLIPDTWMWSSRGGPLREAVLAAAEVAAVVDLGKPFSAAKDTRVQALVLVRRAAGRSARAAYVGRSSEPLAPVSEEELVRTARAGWPIYQSRAERSLMAGLEARSVTLGSICEVGYGLRTGNNPRHVERLAPGPGQVGLAGGEDITPFALRWRPKRLLHGQQFARLLGKQLGRERVAIQRIRTNSKAPWARWLEAAMVPAGLACLDSLSTLFCVEGDLRWALLGLVSSVALGRCHRLRTTDVNVKPALLRELPVPRQLLDDPRELAQLSRARAALGPLPEVPALERQIDALVYRLYGLSRDDVREAERGFWGPRLEAEWARLYLEELPASATRAGPDVRPPR